MAINSDTKTYGERFEGGFVFFRDSAEFADVVVVTALGEQKLHSLLLARKSAFFLKALTSDFAEGKSKRISLHFDKSMEAWPLLLDYFYTDTLTLTEDVVTPVLALSRQLLMPRIEEYCMDFLHGRISTVTCLTYLRDAVAHDLHELQQECVVVAARGFHVLHATSSMAGIPPNVILDILQHEDLMVHCELQVVRFVLNYLSSTHVDDHNTRAICSQIRFAYLDNAYFGELRQQQVIPQELYLEGSLQRLLLLDQQQGEGTALAPPPRTTYCSQLKYNLPGGCEWVDVELEHVWEQLASVATVRASGVGEGGLAHVLSSDPEAWFETNDSAEEPPWVEVVLPANVCVTQFTRYTFTHGHRRHGYYRLRNWKTLIAEAWDGEYSDISTRTCTTDQFEVNISPSQQQRPWQALKIQATGMQEDSVHRICIRNLRVFGTARINLMKQEGGFVIDAPLKFQRALRRGSLSFK